MSNEAINHTVKLTVKDGKYYITLDFKGLAISSQFGYLSQLKYYLTGYTLDQYGNPSGNTGRRNCGCLPEENNDGSLISGNFGTNYPDQATFELIPEALEVGMYLFRYLFRLWNLSLLEPELACVLKAGLRYLKSTTADDPDFTDNNNNNSSLGSGSTLGKQLQP